VVGALSRPRNRRAAVSVKANGQTLPHGAVQRAVLYDTLQHPATTSPSAGYGGGVVECGH
jgi:hypothetical protein